MNWPDTLLAKKPKDLINPLPHETLVGHTKAVVEAFQCLFGSADEPTRTALRWLGFFNLPEDKLYAFFKNGIIACYMHDIGKSNSEFQEAITKGYEQNIRHEHLSGLLLWLPEFRQWLCGISNLLDIETVVSAIIGHHLKADRDNFAVRLNPDRGPFRVFARGFYEVLSSFAEAMKLPMPERLGIQETWSFGGRTSCYNLVPIRDELKKQLSQYHRDIRNEKRLNLLMAVRAALLAADSAGSGLMRELKRDAVCDLSQWISAAFDSKKVLDGSDIDCKVIAPCVKKIKEQLESKRDNYQEKEFQKASEKLPDRTLLLSSCGSGKTLAAWRWIKGQCAKKPSARVIFLYPTRGTTTEGFRDYVSLAPEADAALIHGTSSYELAGMFENPNGDDPRKGKDFTTDDRLFAISYWQRRIFSATVDQFLGFMQHSYRSICLLPILADSVIVIDEVHSFDKTLFSMLKSFLKTFNVPVLCMTASLPPNRIDDLKDCGLVLFPESLADWPDLKRSAEMPRYKVHLLSGQDEVQKILKASTGKVLWVVNTVDRCQDLSLSFNSFCYHSRFKLMDRKNQHDEVVRRFKSDSPHKNLFLAVTTQVCEMSLDLDADILVTESAPITSLIQRMGRCNRHVKAGSVKIGEVFIYPPENFRPYKKEEVGGLQLFLKEIDDKVVSQALLEELLENYGSSEVEVEKYAAFLESGPWAQQREEESLRETNESTVPAVLESEIDIYLALRKRGGLTDGLIVPVPRKFARQDSRLPRWLSVARSDHYSSKYGFLRNPLEEHHG